MEPLLREIKYAFRSLRKDLGYASTVMLTLAVCIGANTATFAIVHSVLLRPLPIPEADRIMLISNSYPKAGAPDMANSSAGDYYDRLKEVPAFEAQAMFNYASQTLEMNSVPERIRGMAATPSLFRLLRFAPAQGRTFTEEEGEIGAEQKVILSDGLWRQLYGGDPGAVGRQLRLNGRQVIVVGVMPRGFTFLDPEVRLWVPLPFTPEQKTAHHNNNWFNIGRLKPGASIEQAQAQVDALNAANLERFPQFKQLLIDAGFHSKVRALQAWLVRDVKEALFLFWGGAALVLLIGTLNLSNLALARVNLRRKELATRLAMGAGRAQVARQLVVENVLVALAGGAAGVGLGGALLWAAGSGLAHLPRSQEIRIDTIAALVSMALAAITGVLMGLAPLAQVFQFNLNAVLHENSRTGTGGGRARRVRQSLVVAQVGLAFILLAGAGLLLASFRKLLGVDPGFEAQGVVTASISAPRAKYSGDKELRALMNRTLEALRRVPGVTVAGATTSIPFGDSHSDSVILAEGYVMKPGESVISPRQLVVTPGYFELMGIPLVRGRFFEDRDTETSTPVVIVDERLARRFWPDSDPIGRRMHLPENAADLLKIDEHTRWMTVVGVVRPVMLDDLEGNGSPVGAYYFPFSQSPSRGYTLALKTAADTGPVVRAVRAEIAGIDPELALFDIHTMEQRAELSLAARKTSMMLALGFGGVALFLSAVGIYGVLAYLVSQRRREIGIRIALGSTAAAILRLVMGEGLALVGTGLAVGVAGAVLLRRAVETLIYGVSPLDPLVLAAVTVVLAAVALAACGLPARRAMRVDPVVVLTEQ
ncbi:MAG TPA: ABC transporter permease [Bryobacteraceae bacterium]|jgi:putative ABC transport system permease protein|nr:ABC transporter permease [Bryobacteraceae bacterium]